VKDWGESGGELMIVKNKTITKNYTQDSLAWVFVIFCICCILICLGCFIPSFKLSFG